MYIYVYICTYMYIGIYIYMFGVSLLCIWYVLFGILLVSLLYVLFGIPLVSLLLWYAVGIFLVCLRYVFGMSYLVERVTAIRVELCSLAKVVLSERYTCVLTGD